VVLIFFNLVLRESISRIGLLDVVRKKLFLLLFPLKELRIYTMLEGLLPPWAWKGIRFLSLSTNTRSAYCARAMKETFPIFRASETERWSLEP